MSEQHVSRTTVINEPLDATTTPAVGEMRSDQITLDGTLQEVAPADSDCIHLDLQADPDNADPVEVRTSANQGITLQPGASLYLLTRFDLGELRVQGTSGDLVGILWAERMVT